MSTLGHGHDHQHPDVPSMSFMTPIGYGCSSCGYCGNGRQRGSRPIGRKRCSYYASSTALEPSFYHCLLDRGWRRSGRTLYKPDLRASCCAQYTIRLDSHAFHASKDQRQVLNRFNRYILGDAYITEAAIIHPKSREQAKKRNNEFDLVERVHESEKMLLKTPPDPAHVFHVIFEPDDFSEAKYAVFENYQRVVHHETPLEISRQGFINFLCSSPLRRSQKLIHGKVRRLGSWHQCYYVDGMLVAVGVLDLLEHCVSAVYFMYHECVQQYGFGKLGALREICLAKEEDYRWWYAGYYVHNCVKMRYKADFSPQYLLDPETYAWHLFDHGLRRRLNESKGYISLVHGSAAAATVGTIATKEETSMPIDHDGQELGSGDDFKPEQSLIRTLAMPGTLTRDQLLSIADLDHIKLRVGDVYAETHQLVNWNRGSLDNVRSTKFAVANLVAAVGTEIAQEMCVTFG